jgi:hypothetical protein
MQTNLNLCTFVAPSSMPLRRRAATQENHNASSHRGDHHIPKDLYENQWPPVQ